MVYDRFERFTFSKPPALPEVADRWSIQLAERQRENDQPFVLVKIKGLRPAKSRLIKPEVAAA